MCSAGFGSHDAGNQCRRDARASFQTQTEAFNDWNCQCANTDMNKVTETMILETLRQVIDPELGCNIVDLGLIYSVAVQDRNVSVVMTLTTQGCPMHESIRWGARNALLGREEVDTAEVEVVWDPPWHPSMMTEFGRLATGVGP